MKLPGCKHSDVYHSRKKVKLYECLPVWELPGSVGLFTPVMLENMHTHSETASGICLSILHGGFFRQDISGSGVDLLSLLSSTVIMHVPTCSPLYMETEDLKSGSHVWDILWPQYLFLFFWYSLTVDWPGLELTKIPCLCLSDTNKGVHCHTQPKASLFDCVFLLRNYKSIYFLEFK